MPVINLRWRLGLREQELRLDDHLVIAQPGQRLVAVVVDEVRGIMEPSAPSMVAAGELFPGATRLEGAVKTEEGLIFIHNLDQLLSVEEEAWLTQTLLQSPD